MLLCHHIFSCASAFFHGYTLSPPREIECTVSRVVAQVCWVAQKFEYHLSVSMSQLYPC